MHFHPPGRQTLGQDSQPVKPLVKSQIGRVTDWIKSVGPETLADIIYALVIVVLGVLLARGLGKLITKLLLRGKLKDEKLLIGLASRTAKTTVLILAVMIALDKIGISIAPFIASLGIGGLVLGFAFKDSLSNLASGILILIYRPFRINDVVDVAGTKPDKGMPFRIGDRLSGKAESVPVCEELLNMRAGEIGVVLPSLIIQTASGTLQEMKFGDEFMFLINASDRLVASSGELGYQKLSEANPLIPQRMLFKRFRVVFRRGDLFK